MTHILGVDPGLSGGFAVLNRSGAIVAARHFPTHTVKKRGKASTQLDGPMLAAMLKATDASHAFVETVSSRPRQAGQFQFGVNTGMIHGILHACAIPMTLVAPASWKSVYGLKRAEDQTKNEMKSEARALAAKLFPTHAATFARVKDDGVAEAVLIGLYGLHILSQE